MTEKRKIYLLLGIIIFICISLVSLNFILVHIDKNSQSEQNVSEKLTESENGEHDPFSNMLEIGDLTVSQPKTEEQSVKTAVDENKAEMKQAPVETEKNEEAQTTAAVTLSPSPFNIAPAKNDATLYFIFDDAGESSENLEKYMELPFPFAVSVLPAVTRSTECAELVRKNKKELMLHQPMQAENLELNPGPSAISAIMNTKEIAQVVDKNIESLGGEVKGVNNHEGSLVTSNIIKIGAVLEVCKVKNVYFLDSRTTAQSKAVQAGIELDVKVLSRSAPFLDNEISREKILERIYESLDYANTHEKAIIIGHVDKSVKILPQLLKEMYPYLIQSGYKFSVPSKIK